VVDADERMGKAAREVRPVKRMRRSIGDSERGERRARGETEQKRHVLSSSIGNATVDQSSFKLMKRTTIDRGRVRLIRRRLVALYSDRWQAGVHRASDPGRDGVADWRLR
jgi:hypothetical protein